MKQLSIIVSVYKVEKYIHHYMESVFRQGLTDDIFELIIINDGTPDCSIKVVEDIINAHNNIKVVNQENQGLSVALNVGISMAQGEYILFNDPDDLLIEHRLYPLLAKAITTKADILVADYIIVYDDNISHYQIDNENVLHAKEKTGKQLLLEDLDPNHCYKVRSLFRRSFLLENDIRFVPGIYYQDVPFVHECYLKAKHCLRADWQIYVYRRNRLDSVTSSFSYKKAMDFCVIVKKLWDLSLMEGLSSEERLKVRNDAFTSLNAMVKSTVNHIESRKERIEIIHHLHKEIRHMNFSYGWKQRIATFMLHHTPLLYLRIQERRKQQAKKNSLIKNT